MFVHVNLHSRPNLRLGVSLSPNHLAQRTLSSTSSEPMPPRLNKRQQRELGELEGLVSSSKTTEVSSGEDDTPRQGRGGFSTLLTQDDNDESEMEGEQRVKSRK